MAGMQQQVINVISKPASQRSLQEIDLLLPWLQKKSKLLQSMQKHVVMDIVRNCQYERVERDQVIIQQGDTGDCFYIILHGTVSVFIDSVKSGEEEGHKGIPREEKVLENSNLDRTYEAREQPSSVPSRNPEVVETPAELKNLSTQTEVRDHGKPLDRSAYGKYVIKFGSGRSFGEIALISEESVRNASIVADETTDLLVVHRDLYNQTLKSFQEEEYKDRRLFVNEHPLFRQWAPRFKQLLEMSLLKETFTYDSPIVHQGDPVNGLILIKRGQANIQVSPSRHLQQYPDMQPFHSLDEVYETQTLRLPRNVPSRRKTHGGQHVKQEMVEVRRKEGYAAAERKAFYKNINLCSMEEGDVIGDIEMIMGLGTHLQTVTCTAQTEVYYLTAKNYERLITKKNPGTVELLRETVRAKICSRVRTQLGDKVPLLKHLLLRMTKSTKPQPKKVAPLRTSKGLPDRDTLFTHLLSVYVNNKAELVEPNVPGSIYYRDMMQYKARIRDNVRNLSKHRERPATLKHNLKQQRKPRTIAALRNDLQRQLEQRNEEKYRLVMQELQAEDQVHLGDQGRVLKVLPGIGTSAGVDDSNPEAGRLSTAELEAIPEVAEGNDETAEQYKSFEMPIVRNQHTLRVDTPCVSNIIDQVCVAPTEHSGKIQKSEPKSMGRLPMVSNPLELNGLKSKRKTGGAGRANAVVLQPSEDATVADKDMTDGSELEPRPPLSSSCCTTKSDKNDRESRMTFVNRYNRTKCEEGLQYDRPRYRDWETGERSLTYLEYRIKNFRPVARETHHLKPIQPPKLARFECADDVRKQPRPGGKVLIKRKPCTIARTDNAIIPHHRHTHYHILPRIPTLKKF